MEWTLIALTGASAVALLLSTVATVVHISVSNASCVDLATPAKAAECNKTGFDQHSVAIPLLCVLVVAMGLLLVALRTPGPALALILIGAAVVAITLGVDLPQTSQTGPLGPEYTQAAAHAGRGLWLEFAGGALSILAGAIGYSARRSV